MNDVTSNKACVLLSGGMDSVAALHWAVGRYSEVRAIGFDYGQPHRDAELAAAGKCARGLGVRCIILALADAFTGVRLGLLGTVVDHDPTAIGGTNPAFLPGRNAVLLTLAAMHACAWWPVGNIALVMGACAEDAAGFADCRPQFLTTLASVIRRGHGRQVDIVAPWVGLSKGGILAALHENAAAIADMQRSWSCYRGENTGPCGGCTACVVRAKAFAAARLDDLSAYPVMTGGDPAREVG